MNVPYPPDDPAGQPGRVAPGFLEVAALTARTVAQLRPAQVAHRARLRTLRVADRRWPSTVTHPISSRHEHPPGWPGGYQPVAAGFDHGDPRRIAAGDFSLIGEDRRLGDPADWHQASASRLWRFHLHYMEWAWALCRCTDRDWSRSAFANLWSSWRSATSAGDRDAWSPYVASLRLWMLCAVFDALVEGTGIEDDVVGQIAWHAGYVRSHLELDVGGNHLMKNLKALAGAGVFLGRDDLVGFAKAQLEGQLGVQVLADGGHYERSPSYHCQVLEDLIDVRALLAAAGKQPSESLTKSIEAMRAWLGTMVGSDGEVAQFNDAVPVGADRIAALKPSPPPNGPLVVLGDSGYIVLRPDDRVQMICDVGVPSPRDLPAHAHAGCLSFEMYLDGQKVVVDTATSTYEPGPRRTYERSTQAHSTVEVDGKDQSEVWGTFRAARRARPTLERVVVEEGRITVVGSHDGYRRLYGSPTHRRRWSASPGSLLVEDEVTGTGRCKVVSRLYIAEQAAGLAITGLGGPVSVEDCTVAQGFGQTRHASRYLIDSGGGQLPVTLSWRLEW